MEIHGFHNSHWKSSSPGDTWTVHVSILTIMRSKRLLSILEALVYHYYYYFGICWTTFLISDLRNMTNHEYIEAWVASDSKMSQHKKGRITCHISSPLLLHINYRAITTPRNCNSYNGNHQTSPEWLCLRSSDWCGRGHGPIPTWQARSCASFNTCARPITWIIIAPNAIVQ